MRENNVWDKAIGSFGLILFGAVLIMIIVLLRHEIMQMIISLAVLSIICFVVYLLAIAWGYLPNPNDKYRKPYTYPPQPSPEPPEQLSIPTYESPVKTPLSSSVSDVSVELQQGASKSDNKEIDRQLQAIANEAYKLYPFLDNANRITNIDAIIAVTRRKIELEIKGLLPTQAYARALHEIGRQYANKQDHSTPTIKRW